MLHILLLLNFIQLTWKNLPFHAGSPGLCVLHIWKSQTQHWCFRETPTDQCLWFDTYHPLQHKLDVFRTLRHKARHIPVQEEGMLKDQSRQGNKRVRCVATATRSSTTERTEKRTAITEQHLFSYCCCCLGNLSTTTNFQLSNTIRQRRVHPEDQTSQQKK